MCSHMLSYYSGGKANSRLFQAKHYSRDGDSDVGPTSSIRPTWAAEVLFLLGAVFC